MKKTIFASVHITFHSVKRIADRAEQLAKHLIKRMKEAELIESIVYVDDDQDWCLHLYYSYRANHANPQDVNQFIGRIACSYVKATWKHASDIETVVVVDGKRKKEVRNVIQFQKPVRLEFGMRINAAALTA